MGSPKEKEEEREEREVQEHNEELGMVRRLVFAPGMTGVDSVGSVEVRGRHPGMLSF